jgi:hypothetical protein
MVVPGYRGNFIEFGATVSGGVGFGGIFEIPNVNLGDCDSALRVYATGTSPNLAIDSTGRKQM